MSFTIIPNTKLKLNFKRSDKNYKEYFENIESPLPNHKSSFILFIGPPGSGKSSLLRNLLHNKTAYRKRFNFIFYICPNEQDPYFTDKKNTYSFNDFSNEIMDEIDDMINELASEKTEKGQPAIDQEINVLLIFDDCVSLFKKNENLLGEITRNRRHYIEDGTLSIWMTTQVYNAIPLKIRKNANCIFFFQDSGNRNKKELKSLFDECVQSVNDFNLFTIICGAVFSKPHQFMTITGGKIYDKFDEIKIK